MKSIQTETKLLDANANEPPNVVLKEEPGAHDTKEDRKKLDKDFTDIERETKPKSIKKELIEDTEVERRECDEEDTIRAITKAVCDDLISKLNSPFDK